MEDSNDVPSISPFFFNGKSQAELNPSEYIESPSAKATDVTDENLEDETLSSDGTDSEKKSYAIAEFGDRQKFVNYWKCAVKAFGITSEGMMLKKNALEQGFVESDRKDILTLILNHIRFPVDSVIELGAGIGRLTVALQPLTKYIVAVDFLQEYIEENKNWHYDAINRPNDEFVCADAVKFERPSQSFDIVFWNWLLMYLTDEEVNNFILKAVSWLKIGGYLFCRESCGQPSDGNVNRPWAIGGNPTFYRPSDFYTKLLTNYLENSGYGIKVLSSEKMVSTYKKKDGNTSQIMWLIQRIF